MAGRGEVEAAVLARLRAICTALPEVVEEPAWAGTRWQVRGRTFAAVLVVADGWPPAYASAAAVDGPATVLTFRSSGQELAALRADGEPFFAPPWRDDEVGVVLGDDIDWAEVAELLTDSYCLRAPAALAASVHRPPA